ncbi:hypothetical protein HHL16_23505 [Pseudoflavitalea sp. G-6-1-2]|uniref:hypothetical protein n=1 Tax=Pseudoflavitalea sp. G-6-1-2 TaxID=2728841 RepID=UPI00146D6862|nr:hypothetical protein [Pseudoflavitalea sp. G-6-1-2]NML23867.1 hypothetical protein [Pseudoflavitalea sp. G-6-1-2]
MKQINRRWLPLIFCLPILLTVAQGCKKVTEHADYIENQPWLARVITMNGMYNLYEYQYRNRFLTGDTAILVGRFFLEDPTSSIQIGNVKAVVHESRKLFTNTQNDRTGINDSADVVKFVITKEMGTGSGITLAVKAKGVTVFGEPLTITALKLSDKRTDSTLMVEHMLNWLPENVEEYKQNNASFVHSSSISDAGELYFDNPFGIFRIPDNKVLPVIKHDQQLNDQQSTFTIDWIISSVISTDGKTLTFSAIVKEPIPGSDTLVITRLCQMKTADQTLKTLNRTVMFRGRSSYSEPIGPLSGKVDQLNLSAMYLQTDINGNIWMVNGFMPRNADVPHTPVRFYDDIKAGDDPSFGGIFTYCKLTPDGNLTALLKHYCVPAPTTTPYSIPLPAISTSYGPGFMLSRDGRYMYGFGYSVTTWNMDLLKYDVQENEITGKISAYTNNIAFISYDDDPATRMPTNSAFWLQGSAWSYWCPYQLLPNNDMLFTDMASIYAYDFDNMSSYCFAGTENQNTEVQNQKIGKAKYVNFDGFGSFKFLGADKNSVVYYCMGGTNLGSQFMDYVNGAKFYKIISRKS